MVLKVPFCLVLRPPLWIIASGRDTLESFRAKATTDYVVCYLFIFLCTPRCPVPTLESSSVVVKNYSVYTYTTFCFCIAAGAFSAITTHGEASKIANVLGKRMS
jgi:hypothetical protein